MSYLEKYLGLPKGICDHSQPPPNPLVHDVVFISVDIEAYEFAQTKITEIGISSLDTRHLAGVAPGDHATNWLPKIRSKHYLVAEHAKLVNKRHVKGCPEKFDFGRSETIRLSTAAQKIRASFGVRVTPNVTGSVRSEAVSEKKPKYRNVVLVGHALDNDKQYLKALGVSSDPMNTVIDTFDTQRTASGKRNPRSLKKVLQALDIEPRYLHNAGNDAAYTLQACIVMHVLTEKQRLAFAELMGKPAAGDNVVNANPRDREARKAATRRRRAERLAEKLKDGALAPGVAKGDSFKGDVFKGHDFKGEDFKGEDFKGDDFKGDDFRRDDFRGDIFKGDIFKGNSFKGNSFKGNSFKGDIFKSNSFKGDNFKGDKFRRTMVSIPQRLQGSHCLSFQATCCADAAVYREIEGLGGHGSRCSFNEGNLDRCSHKPCSLNLYPFGFRNPKAVAGALRPPVTSYASSTPDHDQKTIETYSCRGAMPFLLEPINSDKHLFRPNTWRRANANETCPSRTLLPPDAGLHQHE